MGSTVVMRSSRLLTLVNRQCLVTGGRTKLCNSTCCGRLVAPGRAAPGVGPGIGDVVDKPDKVFCENV